jgi:hypothetical protein
MRFLRFEAVVVCLAACGGATATPPGDGGVDVIDAAAPGDAGHDGTSGDAGPVADAPGDGYVPPETGLSDVGCDLLAAPTFSPPSGSTAFVVTIVPPPGFPTDGAIFYTLDGTNPTLSSPRYLAPIQIIVEVTTIRAVAYAPSCPMSPIGAASYFPGGSDAPPMFSPDTTTQAHPFTVHLSDNPGATICYTLDGSTPTCNGGTCTGGTHTYNSANPITIDSTETNTQGQVVVTAIACAIGLTNSAPASQTYTLQLSPPFLASASPDGAGLPGWDWGGAGQPVTTMAIPADAGAPYGPFVAQQVGDPPCTGAASCSGAANQLADYLCWAKGAPATCACATPLTLTPAAPSVTLPAAADVAKGDTLSVIACQNASHANAPGVYAPSVATTVQF